MKSVIVIDWAGLKRRKVKSDNALLAFFQQEDITQADLAKILDVHSSTVCQWFRRGIPRDRLIQLEAIREAILKKLNRDNNYGK